MKMENYGFIILLIFLCSACSAMGPHFQQTPIKEDYSLIYIYRLNNFCLGARSPDFNIDERHVVALKNNGYTRVFVNPGTYTINSENLFDVPGIAKSVTLETLTAQRYYVEYEISCHLFIFYNTRLQIKAEKEALKAIAETQFQKPEVEVIGLGSK